MPDFLFCKHNAIQIFQTYLSYNLHKMSNKFKLRKQFSRLNCRLFSFANRCIDAWNSLSDDDVCAPSVPVFKCRHVRFFAE